MSFWSKRAIVEQAYAELALAGYDFDLTPEEMIQGAVRLDAMIASWSAEGITLSYEFGLTPDEASLDLDSNLPLIAIEAVYLNLAIRLSAGKGKAVAGSTKALARDAKDSLLAVLTAAALRPQQLAANFPRGAGNRGRHFNLTPDAGTISQGGDGNLDFGG